MKILEAASYVALFAVCSFGAFRLWQFKPESPVSTPTYYSAPAAPASVSGRIPVDLTTRDRWLVLVLSTQCHFCVESAPFHEELVKMVGKSGNTGLIAVFPQTKQEVEKYEAAHDFRPDTVLTDVSLNQLQVRGTPTLMLVDNRGTVLKHWEGRLPESKQMEVRSQLGIKD